MTSLHISRVRLKSLRGEALASIAPLLIPDDPKQRPGHAHRVLWLLFQDIPDSTRDFLWRDEGDGRFMLLSARPPIDPHGLFQLDTKLFEPKLAPGNRLAFALRANPTVSSKTALDPTARSATADGKRPRGKRIDVVMKALHGVPRTEWDAATGRAASGRAIERDRLVVEATRAWLAAQMTKAGAALDTDPTALAISNYVQVPLDRRSGRERRASGDTGRPGGFSTVDITGSLIVNDPGVFLTKLAHGFGSAKAFGCGLMLIRRA
jgi:CRISPR system Cascade subunit CasE